MTSSIEGTLANILACLKDQKKEIHDAKEETNRKLEKFMFTMENNVADIKKDVKDLNVRMEGNKKEFRDKQMEMDKEAKREQAEMNDRLKCLEEAIKGTSFYTGNNSEMN